MEKAEKEKKEAQEWRHSSVSGGWLTTGDVARRVGVSPGTARYYAGLLLDRGYPLRREQRDGGEEYLWPPEVAEVLRLAYHVARSVSPRIPVEEALSLLETAGKLARDLREGAPTIPEVARDLAGLREVVAALREEAEEWASLREEFAEAHRFSVQAVQAEASRAVREVEKAAREALSRVVNPVAPAATLAVLSSLFAVLVLALSSLQSGGWVAVLPYLGAALLGGAVVWFVRG